MWTESALVTEWRLEAARGGDEEGFFRYWTPSIKKLLGETSQADGGNQFLLLQVLLCHMGCRVGNGVGDVEEVTFLYGLTPGACLKCYGVNVALLAG
ncbi:hypothetical protein CMV_016637 [Castanea mollissima]|uniref:Uncharacterized protein n=1 Tax=Castanea mollissima TaxID=60419 RepID=A0A8J4VRK7_9ROSI|nr:hypothetical protein CMV_016637 [Castanea mollissima]